MQQNTYDIFISYRHTERDRAWAKWLLVCREKCWMFKDRHQA